MVVDDNVVGICKDDLETPEILRVEDEGRRGDDTTGFDERAGTWRNVDPLPAIDGFNGAEDPDALVSATSEAAVGFVSSMAGLEV